MARKRTTVDDQTISPSTSKDRKRDRHKPRKTLSLPHSLYSALEELAKKNHRPVLWEAKLALENHLAAHESAE